MKLTKVRIQNYRLLRDVEIDIDSETTLIVGRNNTAKTSCSQCIGTLLKGGTFSFYDYPISERDNLFKNIEDFMKHELTFDELRNNIKTISIDFDIDYSLEEPDDNLGTLSPFIIDVDENTTTALIKAEYRLRPDEQSLFNLIKDSYYKENIFAPASNSQDSIKNNFNKIFELVIYAINPLKQEEKQIKKLKELQDLFPFYIIPAERMLGEDGSQNNSLSGLISSFFDTNDNNLDSYLAEKIKALQDVVNSANLNLQIQSDELLSDIVNKSIGFGYPNSEELQLAVITKLSVNEQIINKTELAYTQGTDNGKLPSSHNGLGYKNLIKMEFLLMSFAKEMEKCSNACIPLLFIEEPESHMHPQMQHTFAKYLEDFLSKISSVHIQTFLTTHSSHIANTMEFSKIRYAQKSINGVIFKNLKDFAEMNKDNTDFIRKYLTLTKCDLFFADKAILVEGASERLLLPDMINKCKQAGDFGSRQYTLTEQYYTIVEIGGAYAYKFIPFIEFLGLPCLIITDLDSVEMRVGSDGKNHLQSGLACNGQTTSNETIKWWIRKKKGLQNDRNIDISLSDVVSMPPDDKTMNKCHIEFQTKEDGLCGRSLEEAIINVNRGLFKIDSKATEEDLKFKNKSKTDFALKLICENKDYAIPSYLKTGLKWLNEQSLFD